MVAPTLIFLVLLVSNIQCEKGYHLMNDEEENAKEVYDFFKGPGITSEDFYWLNNLEIKIRLCDDIFLFFKTMLF